MSSWVGIDVSKETLDVCLLVEGQAYQPMQFANSEAGIKALGRWLKRHGGREVSVCLEATGIYSDAVAERLYEAGHGVSVVNPARMKAYAASQMRRNKTDKLDAALMAEYCRTQQPSLWTPPDPALKHLRQLVRHLDDLKAEYQRVSNRLEGQSNPAIEGHLQGQQALLKQQIEHTRTLIREHLDQHPDLKQDKELLTSIPGIGDITACQLLAELGDWKRFGNVREVVAFVGLNPRQSQSGQRRVTQGISRMGRSRLRASLYMPAIVAKRCNPRLSVWAQQLEARGLTGKQVIVAVMRKLVHLAYGVLKSGRAFDPCLGVQTLATA